MKIVNIIVILLSVCSNFCAWGQQKNVNQLSREEEKDGFQLLFDGQSLNNWINNAEEYFVEDGCIVKNLLDLEIFIRKKNLEILFYVLNFN